MPGHGQNIVGAALAGVGGSGGTLEQLGAGGDDRQRRFQLMGGGGHKIPLLRHGVLQRPDRPLGEQDAAPEKGKKAD